MAKLGDTMQSNCHGHCIPLFITPCSQLEDFSEAAGSGKVLGELTSMDCPAM
jgi:hypothetical protein